MIILSEKVKDTEQRNMADHAELKSSSLINEIKDHVDCADLKIQVTALCTPLPFSCASEDAFVEEVSSESRTLFLDFSGTCKINESVRLCLKVSFQKGIECK